MELVKTEFGYNFWKGLSEDGRPFFNVTPQKQNSPKGGYIDAEYICKIKGVPNRFI